MTPRERARFQDYTHIIDDMLSEARRARDDNDYEPQPVGTRLEMEQALEAALGAMRRQAEVAQAEPAVKPAKVA